MDKIINGVASEFDFPVVETKYANYTNETFDELRKEIDRLNKVINDLREYMLDIDFKMGWQYAEYLDKLLGINSNYKKYGVAKDLNKEEQNEKKIN